MNLVNQLNKLKESLDKDNSKDSISIINAAIEAVELNEKLKSNVTRALNALTEETMQKLQIMDEKQELIEALCLLIEMTRKYIYAANSYPAFDNAVEIVRKHITQPVGSAS